MIEVIIEFSLFFFFIFRTNITDGDWERLIKVLLDAMFADILQRFVKAAFDAGFVYEREDISFIDQLSATLDCEPGGSRLFSELQTQITTFTYKNLTHR